MAPRARLREGDREEQDGANLDPPSGPIPRPRAGRGHAELPPGRPRPGTPLTGEWRVAGAELSPPSARRRAGTVPLSALGRTPAPPRARREAPQPT